GVKLSVLLSHCLVCNYALCLSRYCLGSTQLNSLSNYLHRGGGLYCPLTAQSQAVSHKGCGRLPDYSTPEHANLHHHFSVVCDGARWEFRSCHPHLDDAQPSALLPLVLHQPVAVSHQKLKLETWCLLAQTWQWKASERSLHVPLAQTWPPTDAVAGRIQPGLPSNRPRAVQS